MSLKDYTRKDITEIRKYLVSLIEKVDTKKQWTDRNESDLGMVILELIAGVADMLNFYIDKQALENYLPTVTQRKNMKRILSLVGYEMKGRTAAQCKGTITLSEPLEVDLIIPKYFQVSCESTEEPIFYAVKEDTKIAAGEKSVLVDLVQGMVVENNLTVSDLLRSRTITIRDTSVAQDSVMLKVGTDYWTEVDDVLYDEEFDTKYSVHIDNDDCTYIEFGYYWKDFLPADYTTPVKVIYLSTRGEAGAVNRGLVSQISSSLKVDGVDYTRYLSITNIEDASGGSSEESMESARIKAPHLVKSRDLMVTLADYEAFAETCPGVYKAKAIDWTVKDSFYIGVPYQVDLYIIPEDTDTYVASKGLCDDVYNRLLPHKWSSIQLNILPADIIDIDIDADVYTADRTSHYAEIKKQAEKTYWEYFDKHNHEFNETFTTGRIETVLLNNTDIPLDFVEARKPDAPIRLTDVQFPRLRSLNLNIISTDEFEGDTHVSSVRHR